MGRRKWLVLAFALICAVTPEAGAVHVIPAVDLPSAVPDSVRDQTARSLALGRDTLGRALHPFRGEFHGLGVHQDGYSYANDLSADGRVVVGSDYDLTSGYRGYVWSPATGKVNYNLLPNGSTGQTLATTVSADGVYVAGEIRSPDTEPGFRWSLAGRELISPPEGTNLQVAAISGNGGVTVGTTTKRQEIVLHGNDPYFIGNLNDDTPSAAVENYTQAFRYTHGGGVQEVGSLTALSGTGFNDSTAADVTRDGQAVLVNGYNPYDYGSPLIEPFLWEADGTVVSLGQANVWPIPGALNRPSYGRYATTASAVSSDGSTVVGKQSGPTGSFYNFPNTDSAYAGDQAVLWREETGWIELGSLKNRVRLADDVNGNGNFLDYWWGGGFYTPGSTATAVSGDGSRVLGTTTTQRPILFSFGYYHFTTQVPFLWDEQRGMRELADVLSLDYGLDFEGWSLYEATALSDDGTTIIGNGRNPNGESEAWRAVLDRNTPDGDFDFDGDVDHHDYQMLAGNLGLDSDTNAVFYADGDLNADGRVDQEDSDAFLSRYEHRWMGDFNADGLVDLADYTFWRDREGLFTGGLADSNGDGLVNRADLAAWRSHFGMAIDAIRAQAVPEPTALGGLMSGLMVVAGRRQRGCC